MNITKIKYIAKQIYFSNCYIINKGKLCTTLNGLKVIQFVCQGNICRSAFSEYYAKNLFRKKGICIDIISSGLSAKQAERSPENAIIAANEFGIDLSEHKPILITKNNVDNSSIIIGMHYQNYKDFTYRYPADEGKFFLLKHLVWPRYFLLNINDPYDRPLDEYIKCFKVIKDCIDTLADNIELAMSKYNKIGRK